MFNACIFRAHLLVLCQVFLYAIFKVLSVILVNLLKGF